MTASPWAKAPVSMQEMPWNILKVCDLPQIYKAINAKKAREAAKKARERAREQGKKKEKALKFDSKLADCYSKDRKKCEIYITEGDSASGKLKEARDNEFQAILPVRGKILNTQKATFDKIQKNAEIKSISKPKA